MARLKLSWACAKVLRCKQWTKTFTLLLRYFLKMTTLWCCNRQKDPLTDRNKHSYRRTRATAEWRSLFNMRSRPHNVCDTLLKTPHWKINSGICYYWCCLLKYTKRTTQRRLGKQHKSEVEQRLVLFSIVLISNWSWRWPPQVMPIFE